MAHILIVDDERYTLDALSVILRRERHTVLTATSGKEALDHLQEQDVDIILSDVKMPEMDGLALLRQVKSEHPSIVVVMMSGHQDVGAAVEAMKEGAFDYLIKPFGKEDVLRTVQKAITLSALLVENLTLKRRVHDQFARAQVIGSSPVWRKICEMVEQVAPAKATVLITGESGTGKELIASLLHRLSPRAERPFVTLNAAALPATLLEAELFGYEKGAFTGAQQRKPGRFELADGGTLFLDEIGDMPMEVQVKLLRVLQDGTFERLGGTRTLQVDVRVVAATNKDLSQEVEAQRFRLDLYYRLNVITLPLPPLRERREDIPLLVAHFLRKYAEQNRKEVTAVQQQTLQRLQAYDWPGNVRELENVIERAVVLAQGPTIGVAELPDHLRETAPAPPSDEQLILPTRATLADIERAAIVHALQQSGGNRQAAARALNIGVATLYRKLKEYQLQ
ncbi:MAG TPA: sigma-54 dependent transcriptional regulator [Candidatus Tectomicrobia bacterium]|nr:sigma-54 dependent transcriptional regulator [Candidatus Tectomicrobia bacterium]